MQHSVIYKRDGDYAAHAHLERLDDGRLMVGFRVQQWAAHGVVGDYKVFVSGDGISWQESNDPTIPFNWPASSPRERLYRFAGVMADGSFVSTGAVGYEVWDKDRRQEAEDLGLMVEAHPTDDELVLVGGRRMFVQRSTDGGGTWDRREWAFPGNKLISCTGGPRSARCADGTVVVPVYAADSTGRTRGFAWRSADNGVTWRLMAMGSASHGVDPNVTTCAEVAPGRLLALSRAGAYGLGYLVEKWSDDNGLTWSHTAQTEIYGYPAHLLKLRDGRVLCSYGYRRDPMGARAVVSNDQGVTWDIANTVVLRDDGSTPGQLNTDFPYTGENVGYPTSVQLDDGSIVTAYHITTPDEMTHVAATRWEL